MFNFNPYGGQPYMQPMQPMQQMQQTMPQSSGLNRVTGADGARAFAMQPNAVAALFDDTRDVFYIKTTDSGGFPTMKAYCFTPLDEEQRMDGQSMTRQEIQQLVREEIERYGKQFVFAGAAADNAEYVATAQPVRADDAR